MEIDYNIIVKRALNRCYVLYNLNLKFQLSFVFEMETIALTFNTYFILGSFF